MGVGVGVGMGGVFCVLHLSNKHTLSYKNDTKLQPQTKIKYTSHNVCYRHDLTFYSLQYL